MKCLGPHLAVCRLELPQLIRTDSNWPQNDADLVQKLGTDNGVFVGDYDKRFAREPFSINTCFFACHNGAKAVCFAENGSKLAQNGAELVQNGVKMTPTKKKVWPF